MLLVIHNLPMTMRSFEVKILIQEKCGLSEVILDNLTVEGNKKRVTVGLADEGDAAILVRKINGLYMDGCQLFVEDVRQKKLSEQPYRPIENPHIPQPRPEKMQYDRPDARMPVAMPTQPAPPVQRPPVQMAYSNLPFYMSPVQTPYTSYENQAAQAASKPQSQATYYQTQYPQPAVDEWNIQPAYATYPEKPQHSPDDDLIVNSCDPEWRERGVSRSPPRTPERDDDWRNSRRQTEPSSSERGRRSPERERERSGKKTSQSKSSRWNESDSRSRRDYRDCSPFRSRDRRDRSSSRDEDLMRPKNSSYVERSPPRDRNFESYRREERRSYEERDKRRPADRRERDRERKRSSDRYEKSRDYDEPRDHNKHKKNEKKRPYSDDSRTSSSSSKTFGNDPNNSTFSVSNAGIFEKRANVPEDDSLWSKESDAERGILDRKAPAPPKPKRSRFDQDKDSAASPKVDASKPGEAPAPDMRRMIIRHNNWRYQVASILAKQIITAARGTTPFSNYPYVYKKLKECIVARIDVRLGDTIVKSLVEMLESYRSRFPPEDDASFFKAVLEKIERDEKESAAELAKLGETPFQPEEKTGEVTSGIEETQTEEQGTEEKGTEEKGTEEKGTDENGTEVIRRKRRRRGVKRLGGSRIGMMRLPQYKKKVPTTDQVHKKTPTTDQVQKKDPTTDQIQRKDPTADEMQNKTPTTDQTHRKDPTTDQIQRKEPTTELPNRIPTTDQKCIKIPLTLESCKTPFHPEEKTEDVSGLEEKLTEEKGTEEQGTDENETEVIRRKRRRRGVKRLGGSRIGMMRLPQYKKKAPTTDQMQKNAPTTNEIQKKDPTTAQKLRNSFSPRRRNVEGCKRDGEGDGGKRGGGERDGGKRDRGERDGRESYSGEKEVSQTPRRESTTRPQKRNDATAEIQKEKTGPVRVRCAH